MTQNHASMTEKELLTDLLNNEKDLVKTYATFLTEAGCENLRQMMERHLMECGQDQFTVFQQMQQRNMYQMKKASAQEAQQAIQKSDQLKQETGL